MLKRFPRLCRPWLNHHDRIFTVWKNYRLEISGGFSLNLQRVKRRSRNLLLILFGRLAPFLFEVSNIERGKKRQKWNRYERNGLLANGKKTLISGMLTC